MEMTTTLELPVSLRDRLGSLKSHPRQAYHEVITAALDAWQAPGRALTGRPGLDPLVARHRATILRLARKHGASHVRLFGSRARGDARPDSDLDILVRFAKGRTLFDQAGLLVDLQETLGVRVDLVSEDGLREPMRSRVLEDAVDLA